MNDPLNFNHGNMFLSYIACNEQSLTYGYASLQKYFNVQGRKENIQTLIHTLKTTVI